MEYNLEYFVVFFYKILYCKFILVLFFFKKISLNFGIKFLLFLFVLLSFVIFLGDGLVVVGKMFNCYRLWFIS